jgi:hypothetical protein
MNQHFKGFHGRSIVNLDQLKQFDRVQATKTGLKRSWLQVRVTSTKPEDFRSSSLLECRLGLLNSCLFFQGEEDSVAGAAVASFFFMGEEVNPFRSGIEALFLRTARLCRTAGSTLCRQQALRDGDGRVGTKVFDTVTPVTARRYAATVADFVFFCSKAAWKSDVSRVDFNDPESILSAALFEPLVSIKQTFMTRSAIVWWYVNNALRQV